LIAICRRSFIPESNWTNRDSADAQMQAGQCLALLSAGCEFKILDDEYLKTDARTIWVEIAYRGFSYFEEGEGRERNTFYLPTIARLDASGPGKDWY
jgi:hypothetical protein